MEISSSLNGFRRAASKDKHEGATGKFSLINWVSIYDVNLDLQRLTCLIYFRVTQGREY